MKTIRFPLLCVAVLLVAAEQPPSHLTGKVLLLENERTLEGDIERVGDQYQVRRSVGETWVPANRVLRLCQTLEEAFDYLQKRSNLQDPDERLRLAAWCRLHGLRDQALAEVRAAVELRPRHAESRRLLAHLEQAALEKPAPAPPPHPTTESAVLPPQVELTADSLGLFATRVQPILMNTCASCHATGRSGTFKLMRVYDESGNNRKAMQLNLAAVLGQVNVGQPLSSPLLTKAVSAHTGTMTQAPLRNRQAPPYRTLEDWVRLTVANNPQLRDHLSLTAPPPLAAAPAPASGESHWGEEGRTPTSPPPSTTTPPAATAAPAPVDPFDPEIFNRQMHPDKEKSPPPPKPGA
jgi:hypothetical protein